MIDVVVFSFLYRSHVLPSPSSRFGRRTTPSPATTAATAIAPKPSTARCKLQSVADASAALQSSGRRIQHAVHLYLLDGLHQHTDHCSIPTGTISPDYRQAHRTQASQRSQSQRGLQRQCPQLRTAVAGRRKFGVQRWWSTERRRRQWRRSCEQRQ